MPPTPSKAVLFDCDGVLVDSEPLTEAVLIENLARHGLTVEAKDASGRKKRMERNVRVQAKQPTLEVKKTNLWGN